MNCILTHWLKPEGAHVEIGQPICTVVTDTAEADLVAPESGILHHLKSIGQEIYPGETPARIDRENGQPVA